MPKFLKRLRYVMWLSALVLGVIAGVVTRSHATETNQPPPRLALINGETEWRYWSQRTPPPDTWLTETFDDQSWSHGHTPLGTTNTRTRVDADAQIRTVYLRTKFDVSAPSELQSLMLILDYKDGAAVYLNGYEIARANVIAGAKFADAAITEHDTPPAKFDLAFALPLLKPGQNTLAIEVHRMPNDADLRVGVGLFAQPPSDIAMFVTGPILGAVGRDTITVKAESDLPAVGVIEYGKAESNLETISGPLGTQHRITLTRLDPGTTYYYRFGLQTKAGTTWSSPGKWTTDGGASRTFQFAAWGDSRPLAGSSMPVVFTQLLDALDARGPFAFAVALGDNVQLLSESTAPQAVTDLSKAVSRFVKGLGFTSTKDDTTLRDRYLGYLEAVGAFARQTPFYALVGNHDKPTCPECLDAFRRYLVLPAQNDQTFYSFDYGNAHFVMTNTEQENGTVIRRMSDQQWQWLENDLAANKQPITLVFVHNQVMHPPADNPKYSPAEAQKLQQLFLRSHVNAVFQADSHFYDFIEQDGIAYITTGGAGSPLYEQPYNAAWSQHHALVVSVQAKTIIVEAILPNGQILDRRVINVVEKN